MIEIKHLVGRARTTDKERNKGMENLKGDGTCVDYMNIGDECQ